MPRIFQTLLLLMLCLFPFGHLYSRESSANILTVLQTTLTNNDRIRAAREQLSAARERIAQSRSGLQPYLSLEISGNYEHDRWQGGRNDTDPDNLTVSLTQKVFDWKTINALGQSYPYVAAAEMDLQAVIQEVFLQAIQEGIGVLQARKVAELARENEAVTRRHLEATRIRQRVGELTHTELSRAQSRFSTAEADHIEARFQARVASAQLEEVIGAAVSENLALPRVEMGLFEKSTADLLALIQNRPDIAAARFRLREAERNTDTQRADHFPVISLKSNAARTWDRESTTQPGTLDNFSLGLELSLPIYSGGATQSKTDEAHFQARARQADLDNLRKRAVREIRQSLLELKGAEARNRALVAGVSAAEEALYGIGEEFKVGTRTSLDLLDAQHELFSVQTDHVKSRFAVVLSKFRLLKAVGGLSLDNPALSELSEMARHVPVKESEATVRMAPMEREQPLVVITVAAPTADAEPSANESPKPPTASPKKAHPTTQQKPPRTTETVATDEKEDALPEGPWTLQVSANLSPEAARRDLNNLQSCACSPYINNLIDAKGRTWHLVRIGRHETISAANVERKALRANSNLLTHLVRMNRF